MSQAVGVAPLTSRVLAELFLGPDGGEVFRVALERQPLLEKGRPQVRGRERETLVRLGGDLVLEADVLVAPREQPEVVPLTVVFLAEHPCEVGPFFAQRNIYVRSLRIADDLAIVFVFLNDNHDV